MSISIDINTPTTYDEAMKKTLSVEEAVRRAREAQEKKISSVRTLAQARQNLSDIHEQGEQQLAELKARISQQIREAEGADKKAFNAALSAGWTIEELRRIGFVEPRKGKRSRRRTSSPSSHQETPQSNDTTLG